MNDQAYLDTCTALGWASSRLTGCLPEDHKIAAFVAGLVDDPSVRTVASAFTLMEFYDNVATWFRGGTNGADESWLNGVMSDLARWQADGRLVVLDPAPKLYEQAMRYVRLNTEPHKHKFRAMDAAHLVQAVRWSRESDRQIDLVSYDSDFTKLITRYPAFSEHVVQVDPRTGGDLTRRAAAPPA